MDLNTYALEREIATRLAERRAHAARQAVVAALGGRAAPGLRVRLGLALIRAGHRLAGRPAPSLRPA